MGTNTFPKKPYLRRLERRADFFAAFRVVFFAVFRLAALRFGAFLAAFRFFIAIRHCKEFHVKDLTTCMPDRSTSTFVVRCNTSLLALCVYYVH